MLTLKFLIHDTKVYVQREVYHGEGDSKSSEYSLPIIDEATSEMISDVSDACIGEFAAPTNKFDVAANLEGGGA
jgi:hypothetical protein